MFRLTKTTDQPRNQGEVGGSPTSGSFSGEKDGDVGSGMKDVVVQ